MDLTSVFRCRRDGAEGMKPGWWTSCCGDLGVKGYREFYTQFVEKKN